MTEAQLRQQVIQLRQQAAAELESIIPEAEAAASAIGPEAVSRVEQWKNALAETRLVVNELAVRLKGAFGEQFATLLSDLVDGVGTLQDAFLDFGDSVVQAFNRILAERFAQKLLDAFTPAGGAGGGAGGALGGIGALFSKFFGMFHAGGIIGEGAPMKRLPALAFAGAPRLHSGGILGLGPNEIPIIGQAGEEVLTRDDPRHTRNGGGAPIIHFSVVAQDANSFLRSEGQIEAMLRRAAERGQRNT